MRRRYKHVPLNMVSCRSSRPYVLKSPSQLRFEQQKGGDSSISKLVLKLSSHV